MRNRWFLFWMALAALLAPMALRADEEIDGEGEIVRGAFVRRDLEKTERVETFVCHLSGVACPSLTFVLERQVTTVYHEVNLYQAMRRKPTAQTADGNIEYTLVIENGRLIEGERNRRVEVRTVGPLADEPVCVNGISLKTNDMGIVVDNGEIGLLDHFDNLRVLTATVAFEHETLGRQELVLYRSIPRRNQRDERNLDKPMNNDILVAFGRDFTKKRQKPEREHLAVEVSGLPERVEPGQRLRLTVTVRNHGDRPTNCLLGRSFSGQDWLTGRLFYFGNIEPGKSQEFTRQVIVPKDYPVDRAFVTIAFQDSWAPLPELTQTLELAF